MSVTVIRVAGRDPIVSRHKVAPFVPDATGLLADRSDFDEETPEFSYLATDEGLIYFRKTTEGQWSDGILFPGPAGDDGADGADGSDGADGAPGSVWRSGSGAPAGGLGIVGDWYLNTANGDVYEKTGASAYTLRDNLTGPQGEPGESGEGGGGVTDHGALTGLSDDDHTQYHTDARAATWGDARYEPLDSAYTKAEADTRYVNETDHTKAAHDALDIDADTLDGHDTSYFATASSVTDHTGDATAAHAASAISFSPAGTIAATDVQAAIAEVASEAGGGALPTPISVIDIRVYTATLSMSNQPAGITELANSVGRGWVDLTNATQMRIVAGMTSQGGVAGAELRVQYSTDESAWNYVDASAGPAVDINATSTTIKGSWVNITAGAKADVVLRIIGINGNGVADPSFRMIQVQVK